jgi:hypothetical protein
MHRRQPSPARRQLEDTVPPPSDRVVSANDPCLGILVPPDLDFAHFFLGDAMIENVRQRGFRIDPEAQLHPVVLSVQPLAILLRTELS